MRVSHTLLYTLQYACCSTLDSTSFFSARVVKTTGQAAGVMHHSFARYKAGQCYRYHMQCYRSHRQSCHDMHKHNFQFQAFCHWSHTHHRQVTHKDAQPACLSDRDGLHMLPVCVCLCKKDSFCCRLGQCPSISAWRRLMVLLRTSPGISSGRLSSSRQNR